MKSISSILALAAIALGSTAARAEDFELHFACESVGPTEKIDGGIWQKLDRTRGANPLFSTGRFSITAATLYSDGDARHGRRKRDVEVSIAPDAEFKRAAFAHLSLVPSASEIVYSNSNLTLVLPKTEKSRASGTLYLAPAVEGERQSRRPRVKLRCFYHRTRVYASPSAVPFG